MTSFLRYNDVIITLLRHVFVVGGGGTVVSSEFFHMFSLSSNMYHNAILNCAVRGPVVPQTFANIIVYHPCSMRLFDTMRSRYIAVIFFV